KPDPAAYAALLAALGEEAGDVVFVDDNAANVAAANELGLVGVLLDAGFPRRWREAVPGLALPPELTAADWS
ncbi:MAG TPA: HAD-IA family hydrolase, partial [Trueperaceae bacterium]|nr:HAD-IA family hydrolase [Trueperaceae bacterium]